MGGSRHIGRHFVEGPRHTLKVLLSLLLLGAGLYSLGTTRAANADTLSGGCSSVNDPIYDGSRTGGEVIAPFKAGEAVHVQFRETVSGTPTSYELDVNGAPVATT